ncbi:MAG TPA: DsbA family oxidoreductase [Casimicrobiaceae bacterium]|jgi:predicted DsbA family dithiol-disulfide isomerase
MDTTAPPPAVTAANLTVDVVSDVVCPWCYIGKRRLESALAELRAGEPDLSVAVRWHPFQLNPDLPAEGMDRRAYLEAKWGSAERAAQNYERVQQAARASGLELAVDRIARQPNTLDAHRLIAWAQSEDPSRASELVERLFQAYFVEGRLVGDRAELARIAGEAGYDAGAVRAFLDSDRLREAIAGADVRARELGIGGVPFFIFNGRVALSGAHEPGTMLDAIRQARQARAGDEVTAPR